MTEPAAADAATMAAWIKKSLDAPTLEQSTRGGGYLDALFQAALLLRGAAFWALVARELVDDGVLDETKHGRWTSVLNSHDTANTTGGQ